MFNLLFVMVALLLTQPADEAHRRRVGHGLEALDARPGHISQFVWSQIHKERRSDPPAPPEVLGRRPEARGGPVVFGPHISVQVNVGAGGNDIPGDAANEPSIAVDPNDRDRIAIGWRQFDSITSNFRQGGYAYSTDGGQTWTFPGVLEPGIFRSDPVLAADAFGNFYYSSLGHHPITDAFEVHVFKSTDGGATWPTKTYAFGGDKQWMIADQRSSGVGAGNLYQTWTHFYSCCGDADFTRSGDAGGSFESAVTMPDPRAIHGTLATGPDGTLYIAGLEGTSGIGHVFGRIHATDLDSPIVFEPLIPINLGGETPYHEGPNPGGIVGQTWVAAHPLAFGKVYAMGTIDRPGSDPADVMFINSTDNGETWSAPIRVNDDPLASNAWQWFGTMSVAPNGRIDAIWADTRVSGATNLSAIFYSYSTDGGNTWSANEQVSPVFDSWIGWPNQSKIGDYYHMWSDDDGASLAYSATFKGGQDVYYLRLSIDCNGNGVRDACDVACGNPGGVCDVPQCGQSQDCNLNSIPDECETGSDCNENGFPDQCDIAAGTSLDSNDDGIPDECEGACCRCDCDLALPVGCTGGVFQGVGTVCGDAPCPPVDPDCSAAVFWVSRGLGKVMQARLDGSGIRSVVAGLDDAHAVAVDSVTATLYWGEEGTTHRISRGNLDGSSPEVFISGTRARHLTIDEAARKLYWFDAYEDNIYRINLDGSGQQLVASEPFNDEVIGFSICPAAGHLFWSFRLGSVSLWGIRRANLDGSDVTGILSKAFPLRDIALSSNDVYYGQDPGLAIGRVEFDGTESDSILPGADPLRLTIDEGGGHVYWSSFQDYIGRADLDGTPSMVFISQAGDPRGIAVARVDCDGNGVRDDCDRSCGLVDGFCDMSGCGLGIDCDQNRMLDRCEIAVRPLLDCNNNSTLDICDIASGNSLDEDDNQVPDECCPLPCALPPLPEAADVGKDRFVSFVVSPTSEPRTIALRVRLAVLHDTAAPPNAPDFSALEGQYRYVNSYRDGQGNVIPDCPDSVLLGTSFKCATLGCQPEYRDWAGDLDGQPLHISASAVVPSSTLAISQVPLFCQGSETDCLAASAELLVTTRRWGDIVDTGALPVNALDIAAVVNKVKDIAGAVSEPRGMLQPKNPAPHTAAVGAVDIGRAVDAVKGWPYPFTIDSCP